MLVRIFMQFRTLYGFKGVEIANGNKKYCQSYCSDLSSEDQLTSEPNILESLKISSQSVSNLIDLKRNIL